MTTEGDGYWACAVCTMAHAGADVYHLKGFSCRGTVQPDVLVQAAKRASAEAWWIKEIKGEEAFVTFYDGSDASPLGRWIYLQFLIKKGRRRERAMAIVAELVDGLSTATEATSYAFNAWAAVRLERARKWLKASPGATPNACVECQPWPIGTKNPKAERFVKWATQSFPIADTLRYACKKCNGTGIVTHEASPSSSVALIGAEAEIRTLRSDCVDYRAALHAIAYAEHNSEASDWQEYAEEMQVKARIALGHEDAEGRVFSDGDRARGRAFIGEPGPRQATPFTRKAGGDAP